MSMEHRWSERKPIELDVALYYPPIGMIHTKTRDMSLEGMCIDTSGVNLPVDAEIEVSFRTMREDGEHIHQMPAYVVHEGDGSAGLMLRHVDYTDFYALRYMLNAA